MIFGKNSSRLPQLRPLAQHRRLAWTPVPEIAKICREHKMWLHIDGAYGAGLALLPECKWVTAGWSEADSIVINPHKMLFVPLDFSALYVRDIERLRRLFTLVPEYLHLRDPVGAEINYMDYGVQLGAVFARSKRGWFGAHLAALELPRAFAIICGWQICWPTGSRSTTASSWPRRW